MNSSLSLNPDPWQARRQLRSLKIEARSDKSFTDAVEELLLAEASLLTADQRPKPEIKLERELKFLVSPKRVDYLPGSNTRRNLHSKRMIVLQYLDSKNACFFVHFAVKLCNCKLPKFLEEDSKSLRIRLRTVHQEGRVKTFLEFKGPKKIRDLYAEGEKHLFFERKEVSIEIPYGNIGLLLQQLPQLATLDKTSERLSGYIFKPCGLKNAVDARIFKVDLSEFMGIPGNETLCWVDLELKDPTFVPDIRQGNHSFDFLQQNYALELSNPRHCGFGLFGTYNIARRGVCDQGRRILKKINGEDPRANLLHSSIRQSVSPISHTIPDMLKGKDF